MNIRAHRNALSGSGLLGFEDGLTVLAKLIGTFLQQSLRAPQIENNMMETFKLQKNIWSNTVTFAVNIYL
jgi:hypothetical protein